MLVRRDQADREAEVVAATDDADPDHLEAVA